MIVQHKPQLHLTYCLNIHRGESWAENLRAIQERVVEVKRHVSAGEWFGLGLRLSAAAAEELAVPERREEALDFFSANQLYPFTINGFPYGHFHQQPVKAEVYAPDWRTPERRDYTLQLADLLAAMLPDEIEGSISTVPGTYKGWLKDASDPLTMAQNLAACVAYLAALRDDTGRTIHLGLEPEPDCFLETTAETIGFFENVLLTHGVDEVARVLGCDRAMAEESLRRHLGICFDTCHVALQGEDLHDSLQQYQAAGIRISKIQLSAALRARNTPETWEALRAFDEPVYLHQVKARSDSGARASWPDLGAALAELPERPDLDDVRVHFHVPLFWTGSGPLSSTAESLTPEFFHELRGGFCQHLEIETYTFHVLPPEMHAGEVVRSIAHEYRWVLERVGGL